MSNKTLSELRTDVLTALGFIDPFSNPPTKTMSALRAEIKYQLGLANPIATPATRTRLQMQQDMLYRLGWAEQVSSVPGGIAAAFNEILNEAQATLWRRLELDKGAIAMPARMGVDSDPCVLDYVPLLNLACGMACAQFGKPAADVFFAQVEKYLSDELQRNPPNIDNLIDTQLIESQQTVARRYEMARGSTFSLNAFATGSDSTTVDYLPVYLLALANLKMRLQQADAKTYFEQYERYLADLEKRKPANAVAVVTNILKSAQRDLYRRYNVLATERFYSWNLVAGTNLYDYATNLEQTVIPICTNVMDPRQISGVYIERGGIWYPLIAGIPPECYSNNIYSGWPSRYETRQCIEIWPSPDTTVQKLWVKAHFILTSFTNDNDPTTIDDEPVYLLAVANAKAHYRQPDAQNYIGLLEAYIRNMTAGLHQTRRYIPGGTVRGDYVQPKPLVPFP